MALSPLRPARQRAKGLAHAWMMRLLTYRDPALLVLFVINPARLAEVKPQFWTVALAGIFCFVQGAMVSYGFWPPRGSG